MEIFNRVTLKGFFSKGKIPTEVHFSNLIDSTINKIDDGFAKSIDDGLKLSPSGQSKRLMSFMEDIKQKEPSWGISINPTETIKGLSIDEKNDQSRLFFGNGGNVGIGTINPSFKLDIDGSIGFNSRIGTYQKISNVPADSKWHTIIEDLDGCNAFEIVAKAQGVKKRGKYSMAHIIAINTHNGLRNKIKVTQAFYGWFWHKITLRWRRTKNGKYSLEIKTRGHYGTDEKNNLIQIRYHITSLWDDSLDY